MASHVVLNKITGEILQSVIYHDINCIDNTETGLENILNGHEIPEKERDNYIGFIIDQELITGEARIVLKYENGKLEEKKHVNLMLLNETPTSKEFKLVFTENDELKEVNEFPIILTVDDEDYILNESVIKLESPISVSFEVSIIRDKNYYMFPTIIEI